MAGILPLFSVACHIFSVAFRDVNSVEGLGKGKRSRVPCPWDGRAVDEVAPHPAPSPDSSDISKRKGGERSSSLKLFLFPLLCF